MITLAGGAVHRDGSGRKEITAWSAALSRPFAALISILAVVCSVNASLAAEGGVSFWLPGLYGSLSAAPLVPGWALGIVDVYNPVSASGNVAAAREITINGVKGPVNVNLNLNLKAEPNLVIVDPTYVFSTPVLGGQLAVSLAGAVGRSIAGLSGTLTASAGGATATSQGAIEDARDGFSDLLPEATLRWHNGANNWMVYGIGDIPAGTYDSTRLANLGIGHGAADAGIGYTYLDEKGHEFSFVTGLTYNFVNPSTDYQNGIDWHLDWGASQFLTKTLQVGAVGYFYNQLTPDRGCGSLCPFESRTIGIGPQLGLIIPGTSVQTYINLKGYWDVDTQNRASGMSAWFTLSFSPPPPTPEKKSQLTVTKALPRN